MKYVSFNIKIILFTLVLAVLAGCGSQQVKISALNDKPKYELLPSLEYIPVPGKVEDGKYLPYEAMENPYVTRDRIRKNSVAAFIEARKVYKAKDYAKAEKLFLALTEEDDSLSGPWVMLGDIALETDKPDNAKEHYLKALTVNRKNTNAWLRLAYVQRLQGDYLAAQNTYVNTLQVWRDCPEAHLNLAILYDIYLNLPPRAQRHMEAYLFLSKEADPKVAGWLSELQVRTGLAVNLPLKDGVVDQSLVVSK